MWTTKRSLISGSLDVDDLYGPGACRFPRQTGCVYPDFALFKIALFAQSQNLEERKKFAEGLPRIAKELGRYVGDYLPPLVLSLVHSEADVRAVCLSQLPKACEACKQLRTMTIGLTAALLSVYSSLLNVRDGDVAEAACSSLQASAQVFCSLGYQSEVLVALLQVVHAGESQQGKLLSIQLLCTLSPAFGSELTRRFVVNELLSIVDDLGTADKKVIAENFHYLWASVDEAAYRGKLLGMFQRLVTYSDGLVRTATISGFTSGLETAGKFGLLEQASSDFTKWYHALLQDSSKLVQLQALQTLPQVLCALKAPSATLMPFFLENFSKSFSKEFVTTCAQCLPTLIAIYGLEGWAHLRLVYTKTLSKADTAASYIFCSRIHEVAKAVGPEQTDRDLVPIFNDFHKNKSLRLVLINNLGAWISALPNDERDSLFSYLQALGVSKDWRERAILGQELGRILPALSNSMDDGMLRLAISLAMDRFDRVSECGCKGVAHILSQLASYNREAADTGLELIKLWAKSRSWTARKRFLRVAANLDCAEKGSFTAVRESVISLADDPVANVRVLVAEIVSTHQSLDRDFARIRDRYRGEKDVDVSRTVAQMYDEKVSGVVLPPTLWKPSTLSRDGECRLELLIESCSDAAELLRFEVSLDEFGFPMTD